MVNHRLITVKGLKKRLLSPETARKLKKRINNNNLDRWNLRFRNAHSYKMHRLTFKMQNTEKWTTKWRFFINKSYGAGKNPVLRGVAFETGPFRPVRPMLCHTEQQP